MISPEVEDVAIQLAAISQDIRLRLLFQLAASPHHVTRLAELVGTSATNVCQHLRLMRHAGLIECERQKFRVVYKIRPELLCPCGDGMLANLKVGPYRLQLMANKEEAARSAADDGFRVDSKGAMG